MNNNFDYKSKGNGHLFTAVSVFLLLLNFLSPLAAFPLQLLAVIYGMTKTDVKYLPGIFILLLDRANFGIGEGLMKFNVGVTLSVSNLFLIALFVFIVSKFSMGRFDRKTVPLIVLWLTTSIPALVMSVTAYKVGFGGWQEDLVLFLCPSFYFFGILSGPSWKNGKDFCIKVFIVVFCVINVCEILGRFRIFTFSEHVTAVCLFIAAFVMKLPARFKFLAAIGAVAGLANMLFGGYLRTLELTGYASSIELGSTFTRMMVVVVGGLLALVFSSGWFNRHIRFIPRMGLICCVVVFTVTVSFSRSNKMNDISNNVQSWSERFRYKLFGDRGVVWRDNLPDVFRRPLVFKDVSDFIEMQRFIDVYGAVHEVMGVRLLPHNQVLTMLCRKGWWFGLVSLILLWAMISRAYSTVEGYPDSKPLLVVLLAPCTGVFFADGLTGQSLMSPVFCGNGMVVLVFPGIVYGAAMMYKYRLGGFSS